jgi:hypothetical protein
MSNVAVKRVNSIQFEREVFYEDQTVLIDIKSVMWRSFEGRISHIGEGSLELDCSDKYNSSFKTIYFNDISSISRLR